MKNYILILAILVSYNNLFSQESPKEVTKEDSLKFELTISKEADSLLKSLLLADDYLNESSKKGEIEFSIDTFKIERRFGLYIEQDYSDYGMKIAGFQMYDEYEKLLNKYYKILLSSLQPEDKEILKIAQRNWVKYRDSEERLNSLIREDKYSGGGTIQNLFEMDRNIEITKNRVLEFSGYLWRINLNKE